MCKTIINSLILFLVFTKIQRGCISLVRASSEKGMATHSSILAWRIPWTEEPGGLQSMRSQESDTTERLSVIACNIALGITSNFQLAQMVKNLPAMQETWVWSLGRDDPLEKRMATQSLYSCLGNPMDRGAWWATVQGVTKSQTWLSN